MFRYFFMTALIFINLFWQVSQAQTLMTLGTGFHFSIHKAHSRAFEIMWHFDKSASTSLLIAFDTNSDGQFKGQEKRDLIRMLMQFEAQDYLLKLKYNDKTFRPESIRVVSLDVNNGLVSVSFGVLLDEPINLQTSGLSLAFVGTNQVAIEQDSVKSLLTGMLAQNCDVKVLENSALDSHNWHRVYCTK